MSHYDADEAEEKEKGDLFVRDDLPTFAKSYILPKFMRQEIIDQRKNKLKGILNSEHGVHGAEVLDIK